MTSLRFRFIMAESHLRSLQNIPQTHASEVIHVAPADELVSLDAAHFPQASPSQNEEKTTIFVTQQSSLLAYISYF